MRHVHYSVSRILKELPVWFLVWSSASTAKSSPRRGREPRRLHAHHAIVGQAVSRVRASDDRKSGRWNRVCMAAKEMRRVGSSKLTAARSFGGVFSLASPAYCA